MSKRTTGETALASRAEAIARLNDHLRTTGTGGAILITRNVKHITGFDADVLAAALAAYDEFGPGSDPYGERDFGTMTLWGYDLLWKIDYYDKDLKFGSDDPDNPAVTSRVLTVMLASDW
ncbi:DUF3768 domain-containing protein [Novosphingobium sp. Leaf2]|uniref:DUF3768 domain-containing protein n=1 Tax=Novosphingobium sp. Leaf2 TaxID=1735670 RepID=UPI0006F6A1BB|nr:DUF3768 domain-containing protein [Novosphingobium sp. Leaf2]KQM14682.1 hypothetical protein ASE49_10925 [Novosphingobium sp. Leaf2]